MFITNNTILFQILNWFLWAHQIVCKFSLQCLYILGQFYSQDLNLASWNLLDCPIVHSPSIWPHWPPDPPTPWWFIFTICHWMKPRICKMEMNYENAKCRWKMLVLQNGNAKWHWKWQRKMLALQNEKAMTEHIKTRIQRFQRQKMFKKVGQIKKLSVSNYRQHWRYLTLSCMSTQIFNLWIYMENVSIYMF